MNDNKPYFIHPSIDLRIPESTAPGTNVLTLIALDRDLDGQEFETSETGLQYRIIAGDGGQKFALDPSRGELSVFSQLDREGQPHFNLVIQAWDGQHATTCNVSVELTDVNDNAPVFDKSIYYAMLNDHAWGWVSVVQVRAIDSDGDKLLYSIDMSKDQSLGSDQDSASINLTRYFNMNSETGEISIHSSMLASIFAQVTKLKNVLTFDVLALEASKTSYRSYTARAQVHLTLVSGGGGAGGNKHQSGSKMKLVKYPTILVVDQPRDSLKQGQSVGSFNFVASTNRKFNTRRSAIKEQFTFRVLNGGESHASFNDYFTIQPSTGSVLVKRPPNANYYESIVEIEENSDKRGSNNFKTVTMLQIFIGGVDDRKFIHSIQLQLSLSENQLADNEILNLATYVKMATSNGKHDKSSRFNYKLAYADIPLDHFELNTQNGLLYLTKMLDYETQPSTISLYAFAHKTSGPLHQDAFLYNITITVTNVDDNPPQCSQSHYVATIEEGVITGTFVGQISAIDIDEELTSPAESVFNVTSMDRQQRFSYYIVDGNQDNAFSIDQQGTIRSNIVLDREIQDRYLLKVIATDITAARPLNDVASFGDPASWLADEANHAHLTQCTMEVVVVDQNDNTPVFPPYREVSVGEDTEIGSVIATWTANDVDIYPVLSYNIENVTILENNNSTIENLFFVGRYTGKVFLKSSLSELWSRKNQTKRVNTLVQHLLLFISASDGVHSVSTQITINVKRNQTNLVPIFKNDGNYYVQFDLSENQHTKSVLTDTNVEVFKVPLEDPPAEMVGNDRRLLFQLLPTQSSLESSSFYIDPTRGVIYNNRTLKHLFGRGSGSSSTKVVHLTIVARYQNGLHQSQSSLMVVVRKNNVHQASSNYYYYSTGHAKTDAAIRVTSSGGGTGFNINIDPFIDQGSTILKLPKLSHGSYSIVSGNMNRNFMLLRGDELVLVGDLLTDEYSLKIRSGTNSTSTVMNNNIIMVHVKVNSSTSTRSQDNSSPFKSTLFELEINENEPEETEIQCLRSSVAADDFRYRLVSGNEQDHFRVDKYTGTLMVNGQLDFERTSTYRLGVVAMDGYYRQYFAIININLVNVNEHCPRFISPHFKAIVDENVQNNTRIVPIRAIDGDLDDQIGYELLASEPAGAEAFFRYDTESGYLVTNGQLDYEQHQQSRHYKFIVKAFDLTGLAASTETSMEGQSSSNRNGEIQCASAVESLFEVQIGSTDEFSPRFSSETYEFKVATGLTSKHIRIGYVSAIDSDQGPDGRVLYAIKSVSPSSLFEWLHINRTSGLITMNMARSNNGANIPRQYSMIVSVSSGRLHSLNSLAIVDVKMSILNSIVDDDLEDLDENMIDQSMFGIKAASAGGSGEGGDGKMNRQVSVPGWIIFFTVLLLLITVILVVSIYVIRLHQEQQQQHFLTGNLRSLSTANSVGTLLRKIGPISGSGVELPLSPSGTSASGMDSVNGLSPAYLINPYSNTGSLAPPCYNEITTMNAQGRISNGTGTMLIHHGHGSATSSGRGSAEDDADLDDVVVDEEIRMINSESNSNYGYAETEVDCGGGSSRGGQITSTAEYLARLGVSNHYEHEENASSMAEIEDDDVMLDNDEDILSMYATGHAGQESVDVLSDMATGSARVRYATNRSRRSNNRLASTSSNNSVLGGRQSSVSHGVSVNNVPAAMTGPSQSSGHVGSVQSIPVVNDEELSGSYNWDYLQHWGPKYQPLSSVFAEIARLKNAQQGGGGGGGSNASQASGGGHYYNTPDNCEVMSVGHNSAGQSNNNNNGPIGGIYGQSSAASSVGNGSVVSAPQQRTRNRTTSSSSNFVPDYRQQHAYIPSHPPAQQQFHYQPHHHQQQQPYVTSDIYGMATNNNNSSSHQGHDQYMATGSNQSNGSSQHYHSLQPQQQQPNWQQQ